jgi:predicted Zn-ribbon and HTH transcriptional regulator
MSKSKPKQQQTPVRRHCNRCGYEWNQRNPQDGSPRECPDCHSRNWADAPDDKRAQKLVPATAE